MSNNIFCTVLSHKRLIQAVAAYLSLSKVVDDFKVYVLCVDYRSYDFIKQFNLPNVILIKINELNRIDVINLKNTRKLNQYCWTLKPVFINYVLEHSSDIERVIYIDADLFFLQNPEIIIKNQPDSSVLISDGKIFLSKKPNDFVHYVQDITGNYNSGLIIFKKDINGIMCARWWDKMCINACTQNPEGNTFGDQKYLDNMPELFDNVGEITTPGVNIGHWNYQKYKFTIKDNEIMVNNYKLIVYHFSGFRIINENDIIQIHEKDRTNMPFIYDIYKRFLRNIIEEIKKNDSRYTDFFITTDIESN
ncbi:putative nucleotide-diphospho-sugar transferase [Clostridium sp. SM-530-WT-3G]|uniref:putative nucleotide-diphospho-sugar transferase n=1 Tax=Clostridium sp. SM-530-WT-3G TaxID=2725303 RepID=UPI00145F271D|nr:putative nucleotide-diphospho-sugar transferase [Clostridium sp. SM-530-WT-3G]NME83822.1 hypothetical protein [Clostridium sp. SM-530-WT-3G]